MTIFELLNFNREFLEKLRRAGVRLEDTEYVDLYADFNNMVGSGNKVTYAVAVLADRYGLGERTVYAIIKRFKVECNPLKMGGGK